MQSRRSRTDVNSFLITLPAFPAFSRSQRIREKKDTPSGPLLVGWSTGNRRNRWRRINYHRRQHFYLGAIDEKAAAMHAEDALNIVGSQYRYVAIETQSSVPRLSKRASLLHITYAMLLAELHEKQENLEKIDSPSRCFHPMKAASSAREPKVFERTSLCIQQQNIVLYNTLLESDVSYEICIKRALGKVTHKYVKTCPSRRANTARLQREDRLVGLTKCLVKCTNDSEIWRQNSVQVDKICSVKVVVNQRFRQLEF